MSSASFRPQVGRSPGEVGLGNFAPNLGFMGSLFFGKGNIQDGDPINTTAFAKAAQGSVCDWNREHRDDPYIPLAPRIPDNLIVKAVLGSCIPDERPEDFRKANKEVFDYIENSRNKYEELVFGKALDSTSGLMHSVYDQQIVSLYKRNYPIQALMPTEANRGKLAYWDAIGPFDLQNASSGPEIPNLVESDFTTHQRTAEIKFMYSVGLVSKAVQYEGASQYPARDPLSIQIDSAQEAIRALRERQMLGVTRKVNGVGAAHTAYESAGVYDYPGLSEMIMKNTANPNYVAYGDVTIPTAGDGYFIHGDTVFNTIMVGLDQSYVKMLEQNVTPSFAICDFKTFGIIRRGLYQQIKFDPVKSIAPGISKIDLVFPNADGLALLPHIFMPHETGNNGRIFMAARDYFARRTLWTDTYEELAKVTLAQKFVISAAETFVDKSDVDGVSSLHGGLINIPI